MHLVLEYIPYLFVIIMAYAVGIGVNRVSRILDNAMSWKNVLWFIRYYVILWQADNRAAFVKEIEHVKANSTIEDLEENINITYKLHAKMFGRGLLCSTCFGTWIMVIVSVSSFALLNYQIGLEWKYFCFYFLFNIGGLIK